MGFTLTEVVMASVLLIITIVPILKALTSAHATSRIIEHRTMSLILVQAKLDEIKARSIHHFTDSFSQTNLAVDGSYLCNVDDSSVSSNLKKIIVSVGYDSNGNNSLESDEIDITLATLIARRI
jgi:Tfp pilus assembly protein PilV